MSEQGYLARWLRIGVLVTVALIALVLLPTHKAAAGMRTVSDGEVPFYARIERGEIFHTEDWAAIYFYRPPNCIPPKFNLLDFFNFDAFDCQPATMRGFEIWKNGPTVDMAPWKTTMFGRGAVPVWFVAWPELSQALDDNRLTMEELTEMASLRTGTASFLQEELHPTGGALMPRISFVASGVLSDGGSFWVHGQVLSASQRIATSIVFGG